MADRLSNNEAQARSSFGNEKALPQDLARRLKSIWSQHSPESYKAARGAYVDIVDRFTDRMHNINTAGTHSRLELGLPPGSIEYRASNWNVLRQALDPKDVSPDDVFLDIGSGKGRMLIAAATHYPFAQVIGAELSEELNQIALENIEKARSRFICQDVRVIPGDATTRPVPKRVSVVYAYNPFEGKIFDRMLDQLHSSLESDPRDMRFIYHHPKMHQSVLRAGFQVYQELMPLAENEATYWETNTPISHDLVVYRASQA